MVLVHNDITDSGDPSCTYIQVMAHADASATEWEVVCDAERHAFEHVGMHEVMPCPKAKRWRKSMGVPHKTKPELHNTKAKGLGRWFHKGLHPN